MSRMSKWFGRLFGKPTFTVQVDAIVARVEPKLWQLIDGRVPLTSFSQVRGYVWARSSTAVREAAIDFCEGLTTSQQRSVIEQARHTLADRMVEQLKIFADEQPSLQRAA